MAIGLLGKKLGMTQIFDENGICMAVTLVLAGPCPIIQKRVPEKDGYSALQIGFEQRTAKNVTQPMLGHFKKAKVEPQRFIRELRVDDTESFEVGQTLNVEIFEAGEIVDVVGVTKGRGFSGCIKRHRQKSGPESHGSHYHRRPGSMGQSASPSRVFKGKRLPGQFGRARRTAQNLELIGTDIEKNLLIIKGSIPGANNGYVLVKKAIKTRK